VVQGKGGLEEGETSRKQKLFEKEKGVSRRRSREGPCPIMWQRRASLVYKGFILG